jgi:hypothetical protein
LALDFLQRWPNYQLLKKTRSQTLRAFYYAHNARSEALIEQRLEKFSAAVPLTEDSAVIEPLSLVAQMLVTAITLRINGPDFEQMAAVQTRVAFGDLYGFVETLSENEPVTANRFFGFTKGAVCYQILPRDRFTFGREPLPGLHFSFVNQSVIPDVKFLRCALYFIWGEGLVPLSPADYQIFGCRRLLAHDCLPSILT